MQAGGIMKRIIFIAVVLVVMSPMLSWSFGFVNVTGVSLTRLDADSYHLNVTYDWSGALIYSPTFINGIDIFGPGVPILADFAVTGPYSSYNLVNQKATSRVVRSGSSYNVVSTNNALAFDFDVTDPGVTMFNFATAGNMHWWATHQVSLQDSEPIDILQESYSGSFQAGVQLDPPTVPEPATALLFVGGVAGLAAIARRKKRI